MAKFHYIDAEKAKDIHLLTIKHSGGGAEGILDFGKIESVLTHIQNDDYYPEFIDKMVHLFFCACKFHCFTDGNKRIAATMFLYFLDKNKILFDEDGKKLIDDHTLVALTIMIAESKPDEKEMMISVIMNCLKK